jgi:hypothetical protein
VVDQLQIDVIAGADDLAKARRGPRGKHPLQATIIASGGSLALISFARAWSPAENPTLELFRRLLGILFGAFRIVQRVRPIAADFIRQSRMQHNALRSDLENIFVFRLAHSPEQVTIPAARLDSEAVDLIRHDAPSFWYVRYPPCTKDRVSWLMDG